MEITKLTDLKVGTAKVRLNPLHEEIVITLADGQEIVVVTAEGPDTSAGVYFPEGVQSTENPKGVVILK